MRLGRLNFGRAVRAVQPGVATLQGVCRNGVLLVAAMVLVLAGALSVSAQPGAKRVLIIVGPSNHAPGTHEVAAGGRLMKHCLENMDGLSGVRADVHQQWPADRAVLDAADTVVFIGDLFPPMRLPESAAILEDLRGMMRRGCGIVVVHYATGLLAEDVAEDGAHPMLDWLGGYFATRCKHHQSVARIYPSATITPGAPDHPICRGWKEFSLHDEPYIQLYFGGPGNRPASNVTTIATSMLPPETPAREIVAWAVERPDGGRGFSVVMPHFYKNWTVDDLRKCILNGIVWTAGIEVPAGGVSTASPDLASFQPESVEPLPRKIEPKPVSKPAAP